MHQDYSFIASNWGGSQHFFCAYIPTCLRKHRISEQTKLNVLYEFFLLALSAPEDKEHRRQENIFPTTLQAQLSSYIAVSFLPPLGYQVLTHIRYWVQQANGYVSKFHLLKFLLDIPAGIYWPSKMNNTVQRRHTNLYWTQLNC